LPANLSWSDPRAALDSKHRWLQKSLASELLDFKK
jgi:hypothetical protein